MTSSTSTSSAPSSDVGSLRQWWASARTSAFENIRDLATGLAVLLVEQAVEAAMSVADHVTVLDIGKVVLDADCRQTEGMASYCAVFSLYLRLSAA
ncbi:hypothetical protein [Rhodococcus sp. MS16]|uniref:hypothetical protein n=1 Tax=Rhodococcus sp. MS16 TaxID=2579941 RepID=UPI001F5BD93A|nr:hypothetical protein [Rhodococcus sp. MS16]